MADQNKLNQARQLIEAATDSLNHAHEILSELTGNVSIPRSRDYLQTKAASEGSVSADGGGVRIIEGIFEGQHMVGPDGKEYSVPANYASKSKLVEGDLLKLTIDRTGSFVYKQVGPVERERKTGVLSQDSDTDEFQVLAEGKIYKVLLASVTYFKGEPGDEVVILVPVGKDSEWAAVENVIKSIEAHGHPSNHEEATVPDQSQEELDEDADEAVEDTHDDIQPSTSTPTTPASTAPTGFDTLQAQGVSFSPAPVEQEASPVIEEVAETPEVQTQIEPDQPVVAAEPVSNEPASEHQPEKDEFETI